MKTTVFGVIPKGAAVHSALMRLQLAGFSEKAVSVLYPESTTVSGMGAAMLAMGVPQPEICFYTNKLIEGNILVAADCIPAEEVRIARQVFEESMHGVTHGVTSQAVADAGQLLEEAGVLHISSGTPPPAVPASRSPQ